MNRFCPNCKKSISLWQAEFGIKNKPFKCKHCNKNITNEADIKFFGLLGYLGMYTSYKTYGFFTVENGAIFAIIIITILSASYFSAKVSLHEDTD